MTPDLRRSHFVPAPAATGVSITASVTATFNEPVQPEIGFVLRDDANTVVPTSRVRGPDYVICPPRRRA